jgi:hypothetical protein
MQQTPQCYGMEGYDYLVKLGVPQRQKGLLK